MTWARPMKPAPMRPMLSRRAMAASGDLQSRRAAELLQMGAAEAGVGEGMGGARVLFGLLHQPAAVAGGGEDLEYGRIVHDAVARRGEKALQHGLREAHVALLAGRERIASDVL